VSTVQIDERKALKARARAMAQGLSGCSPSKASHITTSLAANFNAFLADVRRIYPALASHLPAAIKDSVHFKELDMAEATTLDLNIYLNQIIGLLDALE
jgi:hypothetical protein